MFLPILQQEYFLVLIHASGKLESAHIVVSSPLGDIFCSKEDNAKTFWTPILCQHQRAACSVTIFTGILSPWSVPHGITGISESSLM